MVADIFLMLHQAGWEEFNAAGQTWFPEMERSFLLACLRRTCYDDNPKVRLRRNLMVYGPPGAFKSVTTKTFLKRYIPSVEPMDIDPYSDELPPVVLNLGGRGISWERIRGSVNGSHIVEPLLNLSNFYYAPEFLSFLGHRSDERAEKMDVLNEALEEGQITVALVKAAGIKPDDEQAERFQAMGVRYDSKLGMMSYQARGSFIGCTRPLGDKEKQMFMDSGLWSRFTLSEWIPGKDAYDTIYTDGLKPPSHLADDIRAFNKRAWTLQWGKIPEPPEELRRMVYRAYRNGYQEVEATTGLEPSQTRNFRDLVDAAQLLTINAVVRTISRWDTDNDGWTIPELKYEEGDALRTLVQVKEAMSKRAHEWLLRQDVDPKETEDRRLLEGFLEEAENPSLISTKEFFAWSEKEKKMPRATFYYRLGVMQKRGWVSGGPHIGTRLVAHHVLAAARPDFLAAREEGMGGEDE